jgi:hypothetical protein
MNESKPNLERLRPVETDDEPFVAPIGRDDGTTYEAVFNRKRAE